MKDSDIEAFRQKLADLRADLEQLEAASEQAGRPVELDQSRVGRLSRMDAMQAQQMAREASRRRQQQLRAIKGALRRIDSGEYGSCAACGEEIDIRRLAFDPACTRCIRCAED